MEHVARVFIQEEWATPGRLTEPKALAMERTYALGGGKWEYKVSASRYWRFAQYQFWDVGVGTGRLESALPFTNACVADLRRLLSIRSKSR